MKSRKVAAYLASLLALVMLKAITVSSDPITFQSRSGTSFINWEPPRFTTINSTYSYLTLLPLNADQVRQLIVFNFTNKCIDPFSSNSTSVSMSKMNSLEYWNNSSRPIPIRKSQSSALRWIFRMLHHNETPKIQSCYFQEVLKQSTFVQIVSLKSSYLRLSSLWSPIKNVFVHHQTQ